MAKEVILPDRIPVGNEVNCNNEYCASFVDYSKESHDKTSSELEIHLDKVYGDAESHSTSKIYIAYDTTIEDVKDDILSANIAGLDDDNLSDYILLMDYDSKIDTSINVGENDVIIYLIFY